MKVRPSSFPPHPVQPLGAEVAVKLPSDLTRACHWTHDLGHVGNVLLQRTHSSSEAWAAEVCPRALPALLFLLLSLLPLRPLPPCFFPRIQLQRPAAHTLPF